MTRREVAHNYVINSPCTQLTVCSTSLLQFKKRFALLFKYYDDRKNSVMTQKVLFPATLSSRGQTHVSRRRRSQTIRGFSLYRFPEAIDAKDRTRQIRWKLYISVLSDQVKGMMDGLIPARVVLLSWLALY